MNIRQCVAEAASCNLDIPALSAFNKRNPKIQHFWKFQHEFKKNKKIKTSISSRRCIK